MRCNGTGSNQSLGLKMASGIAALLMVLPLQSSMAQEPRDRYREPVDYGPYRVEMKRVIEGYRFDLRWREGPGSRRNGRFRLSNVNTPGIHVKRDCERDRGKEAKEFVERFTPQLARDLSMGIWEVKTAPRSPWQSPYVERLIGTLRRDCLDHVIVLSEIHLRRIVRGYLGYYHSCRTHLSLEKDSPHPRPVESPDQGRIVEIPMVGGLHHRYTRQAA